MDDLIAFVRARLDEEAAAAEKVYGFWRADDSGNIIDTSYAACLAVGPNGRGVDEATRSHILQYDPARVLREVAAIRAVIALTDEHGYNEEPTYQAFAAIWSDHPDYRQEWAP